MSPLTRPALLLLLIALLPACAHRPGLQALIDEARAEVTVVTMEQLAAVHGREGVLIIDVREAHELEDDGRVEGAVHIPRGLLEFRIGPYVEEERSRPIYTYCQGGDRALLAAHTLKRLGLGNVHAVDMKFDEWLKAGLPTEGGF